MAFIETKTGKQLKGLALVVGSVGGGGWAALNALTVYASGPGGLAHLVAISVVLAAGAFGGVVLLLLDRK